MLDVIVVIVVDVFVAVMVDEVGVAVVLWDGGLVLRFLVLLCRLRLLLLLVLRLGFIVVSVRLILMWLFGRCLRIMTLINRAELSYDFWSDVAYYDSYGC